MTGSKIIEAPNDELLEAAFLAEARARAVEDTIRKYGQDAYMRVFHAVVSHAAVTGIELNITVEERATALLLELQSLIPASRLPGILHSVARSLSRVD